MTTQPYPPVLFTRRESWDGDAREPRDTVAAVRLAPAVPYLARAPRALARTLYTFNRSPRGRRLAHEGE